jgi:RNAse (barnase) inhibitor barstar
LKNLDSVWDILIHTLTLAINSVYWDFCLTLQKKLHDMKTVDEVRFDLNVKLMKFRRFRFENGSINNSNLQEQEKKGFFKKIFS